MYCIQKSEVVDIPFLKRLYFKRLKKKKEKKRKILLYGLDLTPRQVKEMTPTDFSWEFKIRLQL